MGFVPATLLSAFLKGEGVSFKLELISPSILFMPPKHQSEFSSGFATNCHQNVGWLYYLKKTFHYGRMWCSTITSSHVRNLYKIQVSFTDVLLGLHYSLPELCTLSMDCIAHTKHRYTSWNFVIYLEYVLLFFEKVIRVFTL